MKHLSATIIQCDCPDTSMTGLALDGGIIRFGDQRLRDKPCQ